MNGSLKQFSISTLLRVLGKGEKTGKLLLNFEQESYQVWLNQGRIITILSASKELNLQCLLSNYLEIDSTFELMIEKLTNVCCNINEPMGICLKRQGLVTPVVLTHVFRQQLHEGLYKIVGQDNGQFSFEPSTNLPYSEMTGLSKDASEVSLETLRSPANQEIKLPKEESRFIKLKDDFLLHLSPVEWSIMEQISPVKTLKEIGLFLGIKTIEVQQVCARLLEMELVKATILPISPEPTRSSKIPIVTPQASVKKSDQSSIKTEDKSLLSPSLLSRLTSVLKGIRSKSG